MGIEQEIIEQGFHLNWFALILSIILVLPSAIVRIIKIYKKNDSVYENTIASLMASGVLFLISYFLIHFMQIVHLTR